MLWVEIFSYLLLIVRELGEENRCRFDLAGRIVETTISMYLTKPSFYDPTQLYLYFRVSLS